MSEPNKSLRIDWFDGTVIEETRSNASTSFADEDLPEPEPPKVYYEKKLMGFKRLQDLSHQEPSTLTLQLSGRSSFWDLLDSELKEDFIVLIAKVLAKLYLFLKTNKSSMLMNLLKNRFLKSRFLDTTIDYMLKLPDTRIVEKRMNSQFWDDIESFYTNILIICEGVSDITPELASKVEKVLSAVRASVNGLIEEHKEQFSEELFRKMDDVEEKLNVFVVSDEKTSIPKLQNQPINQDPNHFKNLNIFPTKEDLLGKGPVLLKPNIVDGAYSSVEHYLDIQFKLLREDCFGPLREGISKYMENPLKRRHENIRVHPKVRIIRTHVSNNKVGYLLDIAWQERCNQSDVDSTRFAYNKQFMYGSLVLLTNDNFETVYCATVLDSNVGLLKDGYIAISFDTPMSKSMFAQTFLMVESEVFFEPYYRVLKVLQESSCEDLPMKQYIVDVQKHTKHPGYINSDTMYSIKTSKNEKTFPVLDTANWPSKETLNLDQSQYEAYKLALTREFAVIQGPPGTGKTFIGIKVATTILENLSLIGNPMLIICYTNHALDQFLEGILKITDQVVRLGAQSKSKTIESYTLSNLRAKTKSKFSYLYNSKRFEQEKVFKQMLDLQTVISKCENEVLSYNTLKGYLKSGGFVLQLKCYDEDPILSWLFGIESEVGDIETEKVGTIECEKDVVSVNTCFSEDWALKEVDSMRQSIKYVNDVTQDSKEREKMISRFEEHIKKIRSRLSLFKKSAIYQNGGDVRKVTNAYDLSQEERWETYYNAVKEVKDRLMVDMNALQEKHNTISRELEEVATLVDVETLKTARVVGATTTTAARRHDLLHNLQSSIVIFEEAAEVLEAHIVASLTKHCQHVILIGDHKQLRPTAAHYKLAKEYNLEISLFERMIKNGIHAHTLTTQRRMRPEFVNLFVPLIYETLDSHKSVLEYEKVRGLRDCLFFVDHDVFEDNCSEDSWSHKNSYEAKWCVALANYLMEKNYKASEVTVLSTYAGQATLIRDFSKKYPKLQNIKITVVDNYQGEESRIVILSLVRSNRDNNIGFLAAQNRICVALSRAREGFYIFGNMKVLKAASPLWSQINEKLLQQNAIGQRLTLKCDNHDKYFDIENPEQFDTSLKGECLKICE